jgi:hypothetical protein
MEIRVNSNLFSHPYPLTTVQYTFFGRIASRFESKLTITPTFVEQHTLHASHGHGGRASQAAVQVFQEKAAALASHFLPMFTCSHAHVLYSRLRSPCIFSLLSLILSRFHFPSTRVTTISSLSP